MIRAGRSYEEVYTECPWAYGRAPDPELWDAVCHLSPGRAVDLGGGQGRHALALCSLGFEVELVDRAAAGLKQAQGRADQDGLGGRLKAVQQDAASYRPAPGLKVAVAALLFHILPATVSLSAAQRLGAVLDPGGLFYFSAPGFSAATRVFAAELVAAAGCSPESVVKRVVTGRDRPRLQIPRRNETRVTARKLP